MPRVLQATDRNRRLAVIFDIDGVVCDNHQENLQYRRDLEERDIDWRDPLVWDEFHSPNFRSHAGWVRLTEILYRVGYQVVFLTARNQKHRADTQTWLQREGARYEYMIMWDPDSYDWHAFKRQVTEEIMQVSDVLLAVDDHPRHVAMYRELGIPTIQALPEPN